MRLIKVIAGGAMVVLVVILLMRPHPSVRKTTELYQKVADRAEAVAKNDLGLRYTTGQGVSKDLGKAAELFQKAADQGDEVATTILKRLSGEND
jgi:TPR repeat protein